MDAADLVNGSVTAVVGSAGDYYVKVDPGYGIQSGDTYTLTATVAEYTSAETENTGSQPAENNLAVNAADYLVMSDENGQLVKWFDAPGLGGELTYSFSESDL